MKNKEILLFLINKKSFDIGLEYSLGTIVFYGLTILIFPICALAETLLTSCTKQNTRSINDNSPYSMADLKGRTKGGSPLGGFCFINY